MRSHEIFQKLSPALAAKIFTFLQTEQKPVYKAAIQGLANQRNLRGVFVERKPPGERFPWMQAALRRPLSESLATHILQAWLLGAQKEMLCDFLDRMEIKHDDDGTVDELPPAPPREKSQGRSRIFSKNIRRKMWPFISMLFGKWTARRVGRRSMRS